MDQIPEKFPKSLRVFLDSQTFLLVVVHTKIYAPLVKATTTNDQRTEKKGNEKTSRKTTQLTRTRLIKE